MSYTGDDFSVEVISHGISPADFSALKKFHCGNAAIDAFFQERAANDYSKTVYALFDNKEQKIAGLTTLACSGINIDSYNLEHMQPSVCIDYFALDVNYHHINLNDDDEKFTVGDLFLCQIIKHIRDLTNMIAAIHISLYSVIEAEHFYERNGFLRFEEYMRADNSANLDGCIPMFYPLI